ncbi:cysteine-rich venom protein piscivorin-like [Hemicordylus capensis]|uniref:cysteine-rich venom protein piscivorin-like n=1 Tax=Hemicordylus capensis TaxID=884348 RepID=UPI002304BA3A|nr:cysteine-rich venom protein piscivorin-like [Hemicordylus capensis]
MFKMTWSEEASKNAKKSAAKCRGGNSPKNELHVDEKTFGENIFQANYPSSWTDVIEAWSSTAVGFMYGIGATDSSKNISPYTQIIWHSTHEIGCAVAYCPQNGLPFFYVCQYQPRGNIENEMAKPYKEGSPCEDCPDHCEDKLCDNPCKYKDTSSCKVLLALMKDCKNKLVDQECRATCRCT